MLPDFAPQTYVNSLGAKKPLKCSALTRLSLRSHRCSTSSSLGVPLSFRVPYSPRPRPRINTSYPSFNGNVYDAYRNKDFSSGSCVCWALG